MKKAGFTIVEIIIVIAVISILATISMVSYSGLQQKSRDTERKGDIDTVAAAIETYYEQYGSYPNLTQFSSGDSFLFTTLRIPSSALIAPGAASSVTNSFTWGTSTNTQQYGIISYHSDGSACTDSSTTNPPSPACTRASLSYTQESNGGGVQTVKSKYGW